MKILQTPVRFRPYVGGVENYVYYLSKELVKKGHDVRVVCANEPAGLKTESVDGIHVERLNYIGKFANTNITPSLPFRLFREDFDILHGHLPTPWSADWSAVISKIRGRPFVLTYHDDITGEGFTKYVARAYNKTLLQVVLKAASRIIVTHSKYVDFSSCLLRFRNKIDVIPPGVDVERFRPMDVERRGNSLFFLSVLDEFHRYKGLDHLLKALKSVKEEMDVKLIVGGEGMLLDYYKGMAKSLGLADCVDFVGFIPDDGLVGYYNRCDVFVLPSVSSVQEGFGMVLLEAMACGRPVLSTNIVGLSEDIEKHNAGEVVKAMDTGALAEALIRILQDKDCAEKIGASGRRLVEERYSWEGIAEKMEEIYVSLVV